MRKHNSCLKWISSRCWLFSGKEIWGGGGGGGENILFEIGPPGSSANVIKHACDWVAWLYSRIWQTVFLSIIIETGAQGGRAKGAYDYLPQRPWQNLLSLPHILVAQEYTLWVLVPHMWYNQCSSQGLAGGSPHSSHLLVGKDSQVSDFQHSVWETVLV